MSEKEKTPLYEQAIKAFGFTPKSEVEEMRVELAQLKATKNEDTAEMPAETSEKVKLAQVQVNGGTTVYFADGEDFGDGVAVFSDEAQEVPYEDGDFTEDETGNTFSVSGGEVTSFTVAEGDTEADAESDGEGDAEETAEEGGDMEARVAQLEEIVAALVEQVSTEDVEASNKAKTLMEANESLTTKNQELEENVVKLSQASSVESTKGVSTPKNEKSDYALALAASKDLF